MLKNTGSKAQMEIDSLDLKILRELQRNAKISNTRLAKQINL